jgi:two-component system, cell cycle response regulator
MVLLDVMMPGMDGFEVCRRLKSMEATSHLPVVMVTALDQPTDRLKGLEAGADDFLTKPVKEIALLARVKSLVRLKIASDELRTRAISSREAGIADPHSAALLDNGMGGRVLIVDDRNASFDRLSATLGQMHSVEVETDPHKALLRAPEGNFDLIMVSLSLNNFDGLRLCSQLRSLERTRNVPILIIGDNDDETRVVRGLEIGVNDFLMRPVDRNEMLARAKTQIKRKRYHESLSSAVSQSIEAAVLDTLTGLHNRRYMQGHLASMTNLAVTQGIPFSLMILDIDHFKLVNDNWGHDAGDEVLKEISKRMKKAIRKIDMACRTGGEEFIILMPETEPHIAQLVAERIRVKIERNPFPIYGGKKAITITSSIGVTGYREGPITAESLIKRADEALYRAKKEGRNRVVADAA